MCPGGTNLWRGSNEASPNNGECQPGERVRVAASTNHGKRTRYGRAIELVGHGGQVLIRYFPPFSICRLTND